MRILAQGHAFWAVERNTFAELADAFGRIHGSGPEVYIRRYGRGAESIEQHLLEIREMAGLQPLIEERFQLGVVNFNRPVANASISIVFLGLRWFGR